MKNNVLLARIAHLEVKLAIQENRLIKLEGKMSRDVKSEQKTTHDDGDDSVHHSESL
ncbi:hypothetical protein [Xenorhabdus koppenhoeferi]|uniref:Uncharacterized protein n=2 Tax=Xenorhabdus koppenhoeferi TaxID=351659 RepID=A0A1I7K829_9GAMM|nr:hypothetical protein SAMN05421784_14910 [Xenorhabdus koppenhoeferi]